MLPLATLAALTLGQARAFALLIGVGDYAGTDFADLECTQKDAEAVARRLDRPGSPFHRRVRVLTSDRGKKDGRDAPTAPNIWAAFTRHFADCGRGDVALVMFSGHGLQLEVRDPKGERDPRNFPLFAAAGSRVLRTEYETGRNPTMVNLSEFLDEMGAKLTGVTRLMLVDACREQVKPPPRARSLAVNTVRVPKEFGVLYSSSPGKLSYENEGLGHGVFTHFVLRGLDGEAANRDGDVTWDFLVAYVKDQMVKNARGLTGGRDQVPHGITNATATPVLVPASLLAKRPPPRGFTNAVGMRLVPVPPGRFVMGSPKVEAMRDADEEPRGVEFARGFHLGATEVTRGQYRRVMGKAPGRFDGDDLPVEGVTWHDAASFCARLSALPEERKAGRAYRLPSAAEWEYACRAGTRTPFHFGESLSGADANFDADFPYGGGERAAPRRRPVAVGSFKPNAWGLFDAHGNVWEWTADRYLGKDGSLRGEMRGGGWNSVGAGCRAANRGRLEKGLSSPEVGFRVACVVEK